MTRPDEPKQDEGEQPQGETVSAVLMTLSCPTVTVTNEERNHQWVLLAEDLQQLGAVSSFADAQGVLRGQPRGRMAEILGLAAAAGEQLGLSVTCRLDGNRWNTCKPDRGDILKHTMAARTFAEMSSYYSLGAAHALANATLRVLAIDPASLLKVDPFDDQIQSWPSFNAAMNKAKKASVKIGRPHTAALVAKLLKLADDPRWQTLVDRRNTGYHRWREQSISGGVSKSNPWEEVQPTQHVLKLLGYSEHVPPEPDAVLKESAEGLDALGAAARQWIDDLPDVLRELGVPVFQ